MILRLCVVMSVQAFEDVTSKNISRIVRDSDLSLSLYPF